MNELSLENFVERVPDFDNLDASQKIRFFAYYLLEHKKQEHFTAADINACFDVLHITPYSNISMYLSRQAKGKGAIFIKNKSGYRMERQCKRDIETEVSDSPIIRATKSTLRNHVKDNLPEFSKAFIEEGVKCYEYGLYRSAIVMTWLFAVDHLCEYIISNKLNEFNAVYMADKANRKNLQIHTKDDFSEMQEKQFIQLCRTAKIISNNVRIILEQKLDTRNTYAHPANITITPAKCSDFITDLLDNVVSKYVV